MLIFTPNIENVDQILLDGVSSDVVLDIDVACPSATVFVVRHLDFALVFSLA